MTVPENRMRIVPARDLAPAAPAGLEALLVCRRPQAGGTRRICAVGDLAPAAHIVPRGGLDPFREVAPVLREADLSFANLEAPLLEEVEPGMHFAAPARVAPLLAASGFRLLNLANNHILDCGSESLAATRHALEANGLEVLGAGPDATAARRLVVTDLDGLQVGWLGCARTLEPQPPGEGFWEYDPGELEAAVREARGRVDVLVASIHMGYMYVDYPHPEHRLRALDLLKAGADLVLMHHAHVLQGIELAAEGLACYSLGNFLLDWRAGAIQVEQMLEEQQAGGIFVFDVDRRGVRSAAVLPVRVDDGWTVRWALEANGRTILERLIRISRDWDGEAVRAFHRQLSDRATGLAFRWTLRELRRDGLRSLPRLLRRIKGHHLRMVAGWPAARLKRWLETRAAAR